MKYTVKTKAQNTESLFRWLRLLPLLFVVVGGVSLFLGVRQITRANASQSWPAVTGVVTVSELGKHLGNDRNDATTYSADISYDYRVNDRDYINGAVTFGSVSSSEPSSARRVLQRYPVGHAVTVYYNPVNPGEAVLEPGVHGGAWFLPLVGSIFLVVGAIFFVLLLRMGHALAEPA
ncbi:MAG: DUF3592 domain-containing protein [Caldilineaceae bacterium]